MNSPDVRAGDAAPSVTVVAHGVATRGGMERQLGELCTGLLERGYRVRVIAARCALDPHPRLRVVHVRIRGPFSLAYPMFFLLGSLAVARHRDGLLHTTGAIVANRADVSTVHFCHAGFRAAGSAAQTSRATRRHHVNAEVAAWMSRAAERYCFAPGRTRQLVAVSRGVARELDQFGSTRGHRRAGDVAVIANGVDRTRFAPDAATRAQVRDQLGIGDEELVAIFVGGDWERKGLRHAIDGVGGAEGWHLVVVGSGDEARYQALARAAGARVHFVGGTPEPERYYAAADALLLPSAYEAFPLVALEAAAAGLALLAAPVSGVVELVRDGGNGWLVARDGAAIAARLRLLRDDPALREKLGAAARESSAQYTWDGVVDAYVKLYATLADAQPATISHP